jgi:hypothetical protein
VIIHLREPISLDLFILYIDYHEDITYDYRVPQSSTHSPFYSKTAIHFTITITTIINCCLNLNAKPRSKCPSILISKSLDVDPHHFGNSGTPLYCCMVPNSHSNIPRSFIPIAIASTTLIPCLKSKLAAEYVI